MTVRDMITELESIAALGPKYEKADVRWGSDRISISIDGFSIFIGRNGNPTNVQMHLNTRIMP